MPTMTKEPTELAQARSQRVRGLREVLHYSREKFCKKYAKYGVTYSALQSWEGIRWNGLTEGGARKLAACFQDEGLNVTVEWLLFGIGDDPFEEAIKKGIANVLPETLFKRVQEAGTQLSINTNQRQEKFVSKENFSVPKIIAQELKLFHQLNPGSIDAVVTDDALSPALSVGDYVAGRRYFDQEMEKGIDCPCIIQTLTGDILIRILKKGKDSTYTLLCTNPDTTVVKPHLENVKLLSVAPILWIRKRD